MSFGEDIRYIHQLGTPFTNQSGSSVLTHFTFAQQHTNFEECLKSLIAILVQSRLRLSGAAKRAVQIAFVISDGRIQEGRDRIAKLIRDAEENNILIVLLIIDDTGMNYLLIFYYSESRRLDFENKDIHGKEGSIICQLFGELSFPLLFGHSFCAKFT